MYGDCLSHIERLEQLTRKNLAGNTCNSSEKAISRNTSDSDTFTTFAESIFSVSARKGKS